MCVDVCHQTWITYCRSQFGGCYESVIQLVIILCCLFDLLFIVFFSFFHEGFRVSISMPLQQYAMCYRKEQ